MCLLSKAIKTSLYTGLALGLVFGIAYALPLSGTGFANFTIGASVDGQDGWGSTGIWDEEVVDDGTPPCCPHTHIAPG